MVGKLSQPGCYTPRSGRSVVRLEVLPPENNRQKGIGRFSMRGSIQKREKKTKNGKKMLGTQLSSFLQFGSKPIKISFPTERDGVQCALQRYRKMVSSVQSPLQALARLKEYYLHLEVNKLHDGQGSVPGIEVGDVFDFRTEFCLIGLHRPSQARIDWKDIRSDNGRSLVTIALNIVVSGGYEDDVDEGETLTYTGEGGNDLKGSKRQCQDQILEGGNVALCNNYFSKKPVRVIRGRIDRSSQSGTRYSYDGFYNVVDWTYEPGISDFKVFKFKLVRKDGQEPLHWVFPVSSRRNVCRGFESPTF